MTYYGINSSSQYGSNFSSVLADSPPPLDDTVDEDDDFVFKETKETRGASTAEHNDASHHFQGDDAVDEFGGFEAFADFKESEKIGSASREWFSPIDTKQSAFWPVHSKDQVTASSGDGQVAGSEDDFADFERIRSCSSDVPDFCTSPQHDYPNRAQNGIAPVSSKDVAEVDDFGAFSGVDNSSLEFKADFNHHNNDSTKNIHYQGDSLNGDQCMKQASAAHQQEFNKSNVSETSKDAASHTERLSALKECNDSDDEFGEFSTSKMIDKNVDARFQDIIKTGLPSVMQDLPDVRTNQTVAPAPGSSLAVAKDSQQTEKESQHVDNVESEGLGTPLENEKVLSGDHQDDFGEFSSDGRRHLSNDQSTDGTDFSAFQGEKKPGDISEDSSSSPVTLCEQIDKENDSLESKQAESDENVSHKGNADSEWEVSGGKHGLPIDLASPQSTVDDPDSFGAFESANCVTDTEQGGFGDFSAFPQEPLENDTEPESNTAMSGNVSTCERLVQKLKADSSDVEETGIANASENAEVSADDDFGDFSSVDFTAESLVQHKQGTSDMGEAGTINAPKSTEIINDDFGDFSSIDYTPRSFVQHKQETIDTEEVRTISAPKSSEITDDDDFGDFSSVGSTPKSFVQHKADNNDLKEMSTADSSKGTTSNVDDSFGDFNTFDSKQKGPPHHKAESSNSGESTATVAPVGSGWDDKSEDFGDFSTVDSKPEDVAQQKTVSSDSAVTTTSLDEDFGDFDTFNSQTEGKAVSHEFGTFSSKQDQSNKEDSTPLRTLKDSSSDDFAKFPSQPNTGFGGVQKQTFQWKETSQSPVLDHNVKQLPPTTDRVKDIYLVTPCNNINTSELDKSVRLCFSTTGLLSRQHGSVNSLNVKLHQEAPSQFKVWEHLKSTVADGSLRFQWEISLSQHKILTSLNAKVQSMLPTASYMRADVQSLPPFASGLSLLEPIKGPFVPTTHHSTQDVNSAQDMLQTPPEVGTPDLNFGLRRLPLHKSVPDIKDSSSDTMPESASLDLDFLGPSLPTLATERKEFKSRYEDDLLGLSLDSGNLSSDKVKPETQQPLEKKAASVKAVWQFGDVTIPLASQETEVKLSEKGRALMSELEDLAFMQSSVLMFPIKTA